MADTKGSRTIEMRVAELEDKMSQMHISEEEMQTYQRVAQKLGAAPCQQCATSPCVAAQQQAAPPCVAAQQPSQPCVAAQAQQPCIASQQQASIYPYYYRCYYYPIYRPIYYNDCILGPMSGGGPAGGGGGFGNFGM